MQANTAELNGSTDRGENNDERGELITHVVPNTHEGDGYFQFTGAGLSPWWDLLEIEDGAAVGFRYEGERWVATLELQTGNLAPWDGYPEDVDRLPEPKIKVRPAGSDVEPEPVDEDDERKATYQVKPRREGLESAGNLPNPSVPESVGTSISVRFDGSNLSIKDETYLELLRGAVEAFGLGSSAYTAPHDTSVLFAAERQVRMTMSATDPLIGVGGTFYRMLETVALNHGKESEYKADDGKIRGHCHELTVPSSEVSSLLENQRSGKKAKSYHAKHPRSDATREAGRDPLAHPKVGVRHSKDHTAGNAAPWITGGGSVRWSDRAELIRELDEFLFNMIGWSGETIRADSRTYVSDDHFSAMSETTSRLEIVPDPTPELKREQQNIVQKTFPLSIESDRSIMRALLDRKCSIEDVAESAGVSVSTVYRRLTGLLSELAESCNGDIRFKSEYIRERVRDSLRSARDGVADDEDDTTTSQREQLLQQYGATLRDGEDGARLELGDIPSSRSFKEVIRRLHDHGPESLRRVLKDQTTEAHYRSDGYEVYYLTATAFR